MIIRAPSRGSVCLQCRLRLSNSSLSRLGRTHSLLASPRNSLRRSHAAPDAQDCLPSSHGLANRPTGQSHGQRGSECRAFSSVPELEPPEGPGKRSQYYLTDGKRIQMKPETVKASVLGEPAEAIIMRQLGDNRRDLDKVPPVEVLEPVENPRELWEAIINETLEPTPDLVAGRIEELRPVGTTAIPIYEYRGLVRALVKGFTKAQLSSYCASNHAPLLAASEKCPWILSRERWQPEAPSLALALAVYHKTAKEKLAARLLRDSWGLSIQELETEQRGRLDVHVRDVEFSLLSLGAQTWLQSITHKFLAPGSGNHVELIPSERLLRIVAPKTTAKAVINGINANISHTKSKSFPLVPKVPLSPAALWELSRITGSCVRLDSAGETVMVTWVTAAASGGGAAGPGAAGPGAAGPGAAGPGAAGPGAAASAGSGEQGLHHGPETAGVDDLAPLEDPADIAFRLLLSAAENTQLLYKHSPNVRAGFVLEYANRSKWPWRSRLGDWARWVEAERIHRFGERPLRKRVQRKIPPRALSMHLETPAAETDAPNDDGETPSSTAAIDTDVADAARAGHIDSAVTDAVPPVTGNNAVDNITAAESDASSVYPAMAADVGAADSSAQGVSSDGTFKEDGKWYRGLKRVTATAVFGHVLHAYERQSGTAAAVDFGADRLESGPDASLPRILSPVVPPISSFDLTTAASGGTTSAAASDAAAATPATQGDFEAGMDPTTVLMRFLPAPEERGAADLPALELYLTLSDDSATAPTSPATPSAWSGAESDTDNKLGNDHDLDHDVEDVATPSAYPSPQTPTSQRRLIPKALHVVQQVQVSDALFPGEAVDARIVQKRLHAVPAEVLQSVAGLGGPLLRFLESSRLRPGEGRLETPPRLPEPLVLPGLFLPSIAAKSRLRHHRFRLHYVFAGLEVRRPIVVPYRGFRMALTSIEGGQGGGSRVELSLEAPPVGDPLAAPNADMKAAFLDAVTAIAQGTDIQWIRGREESCTL